MKRKRLLTACALLALCACVVVWTASAQRAAKAQWEYKVVFLSNDASITARLNELGRGGWELVSFDMTSVKGRDGQSGLYYFKREK